MVKYPGTLTHPSHVAPLARPRVAPRPRPRVRGRPRGDRHAYPLFHHGRRAGVNVGASTAYRPTRRGEDAEYPPIRLRPRPWKDLPVLERHLHRRGLVRRVGHPARWVAPRARGTAQRGVHPARRAVHVRLLGPVPQVAWIRHPKQHRLRIAPDGDGCNCAESAAPQGPKMPGEEGALAAQQGRLFYLHLHAQTPPGTASTCSSRASSSSTPRCAVLCPRRTRTTCRGTSRLMVQGEWYPQGRLRRGVRWRCRRRADSSSAVEKQLLGLLASFGTQLRFHEVRPVQRSAQ